MAKIIFEINYNIYPEKRSDYLKTIGELKQNILSSFTILIHHEHHIVGINGI